MPAQCPSDLELNKLLLSSKQHAHALFTLLQTTSFVVLALIHFSFQAVYTPGTVLILVGHACSVLSCMLGVKAFPAGGVVGVLFD